MTERALEHARKLIAEYGIVRAARIAEGKIEDAPFLVNGDIEFWIRVRQAIQAEHTSEVSTPQTENGVSSRRFGVWAGNPKGYAEDPTRCIAAIGGSSLWGPANERQCGRKRGFGPDGLYCRQHAQRKAVSK